MAGVLLHTAAELVKVLGYEHGMYSSSEDARTSPEPPLIPKENVEELAKLVVQKIEAAATDGSLAAHPSFMGVVWHWRLFGQEDRAAEWVRQLAASDENLMKIIRQMRGEIRSQSFSDRVATATPHVDCEPCRPAPRLWSGATRCAGRRDAVQADDDRQPLLSALGMT